jgi:transposase-like protein
VEENVKRGHEQKTSLTPDEKLRAAHAHLCDGVAQHTIAALFGVNPGRVNEAITEISRATGHKTIKE